MRALVVGGGIVGLSAGWALARAGHGVRVLEGGPIPNPHASSVDETRLIRHAYADLPGYAAMVDDADAAWERVWADVGARHIARTGVLLMAQHGSGWARACADMLAWLDKPARRLDPETVAERYPVLETEGLAEVYAADGGVLHAERIVRDLAARIAALGGAVHPQTPVAGTDPERGEVVLADGERLTADWVVVAAGPWTGRLVPGLDARLTPSRQLYSFLEPAPDWRDAWRRMPFLLDIGPEAGFYAVPPVAGPCLKIGDHSFTLTGDPDRAREPAWAEFDRIFDAARARLAGFARMRAARAATCFYTVSPDSRFIAEPARHGVVLAGFSGHGFKFGPLIGERVAAVADGTLNAGDFARWLAGRATATGKLT